MSDFYRKFLTEDARRLSPETGRFLALGAFGKHPGWDDHIHDLPLETDSLLLAKRVLYDQGVRGQVDTGSWEKLDPAQRVEGFDHLFVWQRAGQFLLGKLWSSSDGKGRKRYPMVICAHCIGVSLAWGLERLLPRLGELEQACKSSSTDAAIRDLLQRATTDLRATLAGAGSDTQFTRAVPEGLSQFVSAPAFGPDQQGWFRILYQIQSQMNSYSVGNFNSKTDFSRLRPQQIRLPFAGATLDQAILCWTRFFSSRMDRFVPTLLTLKPGESWLDVTLGEPSTQEFFCLQASLAALPLATDVPYELNDAFKTQAQAQLADFQSGKAPSGPAASPKDTTVAPASGWASLTQRWFKGRSAKMLLLLGGGVIIAGAALVGLNRFSGKGTAPTTPLSNTTTVPANSEPRAAPSPAREVAAQPLTTAQPAATAPDSQPKFQQALNAAREALANKDFQNAITQSAAALQLKPNDPEAGKTKEEAQQQLEAQNQSQRAYDAALASAQEALARQDFHTVIIKAGQALKEKPDSQQAKALKAQAEHELQAVATDTDYQSVLSAAKEALGKRDYEAALKASGQALQLKPADPAALNLKQQSLEAPAYEKAQTAFAQGAYDTAAEACKTYSTSPQFKDLQSSIKTESDALEAARRQFGTGDYSFISALKSQPYGAKPPFASLLTEADKEQATLNELRSYQQATNSIALASRLAQFQGSDTLKKPPFAELSQWLAANQQQIISALDVQLCNLLDLFDVKVPKDFRPPGSKKSPPSPDPGDEGRKAALKSVDQLTALYRTYGVLAEKSRQDMLARLSKTIPNYFGF